jgi:cysteine synthase A
MSKLYSNVTELIGNTPLVKLNRVVPEDSAEVYVKLEYQNPGASVKDRIAISMIEVAEAEGKIKPGDTIVEPTSGNTGIGIAMVAAAKGYNAILVMPETMSLERRNLLKAYGAQLVLTPGAEGMKGAIKRAEEIQAENPNYFFPQQFKNQANVKVHRETTGPEIVAAINAADGKLDAFISGIGTGGTITGAGEVLKKAFPGIEIYAVEPAASPVLSGGKPGPHKIQGIGAGFVPDILNTDVYNNVIQVENEQAFETKKLGKGKRVVAILASNGERYLSTPLYQFEEN